ncbi:MAG: NAD/FAD-binding protein [Gammaproteobacteria bacterium]
MQRLNIAVVGSGIAGLASAWLLSQRHRVTMFEKNNYFGGHTHTVDVQTPEGLLGIDTGFIVYNERNYPLLSALFRWLEIETQETNMSFGVSVNRGELEYAGSDLNGLLAQRKNLLRPSFWRMVNGILRFNRNARTALERDLGQDQTLGQFLTQHGYGQPLIRNYLLPMAAAIWSCPTDAMLAFPARSFLRFFHNHGLIQLNDRPQWRTVTGGARSYVRRLMNDLRLMSDAPAGVARNLPVIAVESTVGGAILTLANGNRERFDAVVLASHADQSLALIANPSSTTTRLLDAFHYQPNRALLHSDPALMPINRRAWSSWNYLAEQGADSATTVAVTYWMNRLQRLPTRQPLFVSLNPPREPRADLVSMETSYDHPVFDTEAMRAQARLPEIQGEGNLWFAGSYQGYGFHEDALRSAVDVARRFGIAPPWEQQPALRLPRAA